MAIAPWHHHRITKAQRSNLNQQKPFVLWLTGLSGSGKSTLASRVEEYLFASGYRTYLLDGDNVRHGLNQDLGFDDLSRIENIRRIGEVAKLMIDAGIIVLTAFISPFRNDRDMVRKMLQPQEFIEIYLDVPINICAERDPKGLYKKAFRGEIKNFTGVDSTYEPPLQPEIIIRGAEVSIDQEVDQVIAFLKLNGYIKNNS